MKVAVVLVLALCVAPASALAVQAGKDNFAEREPLEGSLPIEVTRSNVGATEESGENISPFAAGRSIWFEWEATNTGWTTIGACGSDIAAVVGIFTGTELASLTKVVSGNAAEGPQLCGGEREYTFKAEAGTKYVIGVDANAFYMPPAEPPTTQGNVVLRIESTPPPPNDNFANATMLDGSVTEEPGGARFYGVFVQGYNWNATTEPGEFPYGTNSGASVWYRWTPPETAKYRIDGPCCGMGLNFALFSGGFGIENEMLAATGSAEVTVNGGATYWISVYGTPQMGASEPSMSSFNLGISAELLRLSSNPPPPAPDTTAPETKIDKSNLRIATRTAKFWFSASEPVRGFQCQLDKGNYKLCGSPRAYKHLKPGKHTFRVKAVDVAGNVDVSPAIVHFKIPKPHRGRR
jgi:hypothetical protein